MIYRVLLSFAWLVLVFCAAAQPPKGVKWTREGDGYYAVRDGRIVQYELPGMNTRVIADEKALTPKGSTTPLPVRNFFFSEDGDKILLFTNSQKVWRYDTRGDYWVLNRKTGELKQLGKGRPAASLMFAKFSPDGNKVAYVSRHNIYVEDLQTGAIRQLTKDGTDRVINGTFDWAYEEEFSLRDGFRWSPDSKQIAYWQLDARHIRNFLLINNTDSIYSFTIPVEYPKVGQDPSACRIGVADIGTGKTTWMKIPGDPRQHYLVRMEWAQNPRELIVQQLNRRQNESRIMIVQARTGAAQTIYTERDNAWIDIKSRWNDDDPTGWEWFDNGKKFLWVSEKDGWRHAYMISRDGRQEQLVTKGAYDLINIKAIDEKTGYLYFMASPDNATQQYLYRTRLDGSGNAERLSPANQVGTHTYYVSPTGRFAQHGFSNANTQPQNEWVQLPAHQPIGSSRVAASDGSGPVRFFRLTTDEGVTMDGWMILPAGFDSTRKYPVLYYVYAEPGSQTVTDSYGAAGNFLYAGDMSADGYIQISLDPRGTPAPKGAAWRKSIYRKVGILNIHDLAKAARQINQWRFVDSSRVGVWGWSGGGSTTLNLLFQHADLFKVGVAIAPVANRLTYDNIYEERYMGVPSETLEDYKKASAIHYAGQLKGKLLLVHGTGDDNVHYQNSEMLINELVKNRKVFQFMSYPNRTHGLSEGAGTFSHLALTYTDFIRRHLPGGPR